MSFVIACGCIAPRRAPSTKPSGLAVRPILGGEGVTARSMHRAKSMTTSTLTKRGLAMQGFRVDSDPSIYRVQSALRFTPSLSALWIAAGTALASPAVLLGFSLVSAIGASQRRHPIDRVYDRSIGRLVKSGPLPENPPPRRFAMALAAAWAATSAILLATGHRSAGRVAGALLAGAGMTVATTHVCVGSWVYRQGERLAHDRGGPSHVTTRGE